MNHSLPLLLERFFNQYLAVQRGLSPNTLFAYRDAMKLLLCFAADQRRRTVDQLTLDDLDETCILNFLDHLESVRKCSTRTRNARLAALRTFFGFIAREEPARVEQCRKVRTIPTKRTEHKNVEYLEENQVQAIFNAVDTSRPLGIRDHALLLLLYNTGARVTEMVSLKVSDLRLDEAGQVHLFGKGRKHRSCPLWKETVEAVKAYLSQRRPHPDCADTDAVFLNAKRRPITRFGIRYVTRKYGAAAGQGRPAGQIISVSPHTFRHSTAMHLLRSGNDISLVQYWLGHADISTTHDYLEIDMEMKRAMLEKTPAPIGENPKPWKQQGLLDWLNELTNAAFKPAAMETSGMPSLLATTHEDRASPS